MTLTRSCESIENAEVHENQRICCACVLQACEAALPTGAYEAFTAKYSRETHRANQVAVWQPPKSNGLIWLFLPPCHLGTRGSIPSSKLELQWDALVPMRAELQRRHEAIALDERDGIVYAVLIAPTSAIQPHYQRSFPDRTKDASSTEAARVGGRQALSTIRHQLLLGGDGGEEYDEAVVWGSGLTSIGRPNTLS